MLSCLASDGFASVWRLFRVVGYRGHAMLICLALKPFFVGCFMRVLTSASGAAKCVLCKHSVDKALDGILTKPTSKPCMTKVPISQRWAVVRLVSKDGQKCSKFERHGQGITHGEDGQSSAQRSDAAALPANNTNLTCPTCRDQFVRRQRPPNILRLRSFPSQPYFTSLHLDQDFFG